MKQHSLILACLACLLLAMQSCSQTDAPEPVATGAKPMRFVMDYPSATRVTDTGFEQGDSVGVFVVCDTLPLEPGGNVVNNEALSFDGSNWTARHTLYWDDGTYNAYAYYPYRRQVSNTDDLPDTVALDQSTSATGTTPGGYEASDLLWARTTGIKATADPVHLQFSHIMSKVTIRLIKGEDYEGDLPTDAVVYIHNTVPVATVDLSAGVVTKTPKGTRATIKARQESGTIYSAIIVPQRLANSVPLVEVVVKGVSYMYESRFVFKPGTNHLFNLILSDNPEQAKIEIGGEIEGWNQ